MKIRAQTAGHYWWQRELKERNLPTVMTYGHGDVVRGYDDQWREGLNPWEITVEGERWYGRGTADNKAQHTINLAAMKAVIEARGKPWV